MEGLPFDFGIEDDSEESGDDSKSKKSSNKAKNISFSQELLGLRDSDKSPEASTPEADIGPLDSDKTPELDTEAPVEHLSLVETEAINQTLASERLKDIRTESSLPISPEEVASENFLENVEVSGDVEQAFNQTLSELGIGSSQPELNQINFAEAANQESEQPEDDTPKTLPLTGDQSVSLRPGPSRGETKPSGNSDPLLSNMVTYLMGRREGRLKSDKKLMPVQRRLSNEVSDLKKQLSGRESYIRQAIKNRHGQERSRTDATKLQPERIGHVLVDAEMPQKQSNPNKQIEQMPPEMNPELGHLKAQTMNRAELLSIAQRIMVDGTNLRQVYESHLVGERGLRRIIAVYLKGGNVKRSLRRELVEREIDFERDPSLRDQASSESLAAGGSSLDNLLHKSGIDWSESIANPVRSNSSKTPDLASPTKQYSMGRRVVDVVLIGTVFALAAVIVVLILNK